MLRKLLPYLGAGFLLGAVVIGMIKCADSTGSEDRAMRETPQRTASTAPPAPSLAAVARPAVVAPAARPTVAPDAPPAVMARIAEVMSPTGHLGRVRERSPTMIHYEYEDVAGWTFSYVALRSNRRARQLELTAPRETGINTLSFGGATSLGCSFGGAASQQFYELDDMPGIFVYRMLLPGETSTRLVQIYNLDYLRDEPAPTGPERRCAAEKGKL